MAQKKHTGWERKRKRMIQDKMLRTLEAKIAAAPVEKKQK